jgi:hypothetical protein
VTSLARILSARIEAGTLARFAPGLTWEQIRELSSHSEGWWRHAIADAEERGLLVWARGDKVWRLSPAGRGVTRVVS